MKRGVKKHSSPTGVLRIISGKWRGRKLAVIDVEGLRPTTDRTKETLYNWLMPYLTDSSCLDMFAGSGSLGLEALSRYAAHVTFIEQNKAACEVIRTNLKTLSVSADAAVVLHGDALTLSAKLQNNFNIIFIDPPFNQGLVAKSISQLVAAELVNSGSLIYIECERENANYAVPANWQCIKDKQTQQVSSRVFQVTALNQD
ncbi:16S rRNA (guanine(966)-N(2))-methyltransferase RsmD [Aliiglaciecola sp. LCG003]|uniref:16S rRNA (guanine(966)-N(2))-methyltransferase RsmD n=1 Tax=Aliiglaciecola sp. LCG003 TaxID=3053655 RepID=UPI00257332AF|nr:16S rRNA (guanine(966)-N(2))-methyltransferase RsmD [Aliiglaciecola sp. LCG003]WJG09137.1 16S rRNA (guanine(966)-N(2))-methyltransferase RsmD [Aliiglaciecola sp. LCG003]